MSDELTVCAAAFLRNKGKSTVTDSEFLMGISMDLHWIPYNDAKKLLDALVSDGIFVRNGEYLRPSFDISEIEVPVAYRPSEDFVKSLGTAKKPAKKEEPQDLLQVLVARSGMKMKDFMSACNPIQKRLNVDILAAALIMLRDRGIDISGLPERVYGEVSKK